ncbi:restriction endonuclease [Ureibacillus acetophenoni]|uniref:Restriction system protein n=1 Tax=Ureibacillus acetophenoni TaxID=614649 RepID=A0A285UL46_9BACL|nr:restriction endonuclease [Ureibacillus acetophenoni]SOC42417.1 restriction system protein [Ureibacillus acetophenoni]
MRKEKENKKSRLTLIPLLILLIIGYIGWYYTQTKEGIFAAIIAALILFIIFKLWRKSRATAKFRKAGIYDIDEMTGEEFEQYLGELFIRRGFNISYTKASSDYGADLILEDKEDIIVVQAKRYSGSVGVKAVQEVIGALKMYEATEAWVVTNSYFTKQAMNLAESNEVFLIDRDELIEMILETK